MAKNRLVAIIAYNGIDGACAAAAALVRFPTARVLVSSARSIGSTLAGVRDDRRTPDEIHVCGLGVYCDWREVEQAAIPLQEKGTRIVWYCGRGYLDGQRDQFARIGTPAFFDLSSNTEAVCRRLELESNPQAVFLCGLAKTDPQIGTADDALTEEQQFWSDLVSASFAEYAKYHDCERYIATLTKLARRQQDSADRRLVEVYRQSGFRYAMQGRSLPLRRVQEFVRKCAAVDQPVLVLGESGVGKEHVAHLIHERGDRATEPFLPINCAVFAGNVGLANSTLFGHCKGAFTGAVANRAGAFRTACGGVLFLDELAELPLEVQGKLLRVLEDRLVTPDGTDVPVGPVDVRVIAATNRNLPRMIRRKEFRADLFHRLATLRIVVPPLRDRREDIEVIVQNTLEELAEEGQQRSLTPQDCQTLREFDWPGNVRQLRQVLRRAALLDMPIPEIIREEAELGSLVPSEDTEADDLLPSSVREIRPIKEIERRYAEQAVTLCGGNLRQAARALGVAVNTLRAWLKQR